MKSPITQQTSTSDKLVLSSWVKVCYVIAHREQVESLTNAIRAEGIQTEVIRLTYTDEQSAWSPSLKCLLTHREAWRRAVRDGHPWMAVEADFVPCVGIGRTPIPLRSNPSGKRILYLYACGPSLYRVVDINWAEGDAGGCVALAGDPEVAQMLLDMTEDCLAGADPHLYSLWDTRISSTLRRKLGVRTLIPLRHAGEHGGNPNSEHRSAGLNATHRADRLQAPLHFLPTYAQGKLIQYRWTRVRYWIHGCGRMVFGRLAHRQIFWRLNNSVCWFILRRLFGGS